MARQQSIMSLQRLRYEVTATVLGARINPTADPIVFALTAPGVDPSSFPGAGAWETAGTGNSVRYFATVTVGPGGALVPAKGKWDVWVKVTDSPEVPVFRLDTITIT